MKRTAYLPTVLFAICLLAGTMIFQGCKEKDPDVENIQTWVAEHVSAPQEVDIQFSVGDKEGNQWVSAYRFVLRVTLDGGGFEVIKSVEDNKGIAKFIGNEIALPLVSDGIDDAPHHIANNSTLTITKLDNTRFGVNYTVFISDGSEYSGSTVAEIKQ